MRNDMQETINKMVEDFNNIISKEVREQLEKKIGQKFKSEEEFLEFVKYNLYKTTNYQSGESKIFVKNEQTPFYTYFEPH